MKKSIILILLMYSNFSGKAQLKNTWLFGYHSFTAFPELGGTMVNFFGNVPNVFNHPQEMNYRYANSSICDSAGNMLFYTNGGYIANALDDTMLNGSGINPSWYTTNWIYDGLKIPQANIIIPKPGSDSLYYLFHKTMDFTNLALYQSNYFYLSTINMMGDSGRGEVIDKNRKIIIDTLGTSSLTACKHANGRDWWLLVQKYGVQSSFYTVLVTPDTVEVINFQTYPVDGMQGGTAYFSPDGSKYVWNNWFEMDFFEFDRCSGALTLVDDTVFADEWGWLGASISPNSRYCYVSRSDSILQFDLNAIDISSSVQIVAVYDSFQGPLPTTFWMHQLGPDGKIYMSTAGSTFYLHTIDQPDNAGLACNVLQHSVNLTRYNVTIPNFPNYDLGRLIGSPCDTLQWTNLTPSLSKGEGAIRIAPNPANNSFYIKYDIPTNENLLFVLYDSYGKEVMRKNLYGTFKNLLVHTESLNNGIYFWRAVSEPVSGAPLSKWRGVGGEVGAQSGKIVILH